MASLDIVLEGYTFSKEEKLAFAEEKITPIANY